MAELMVVEIDNAYDADRILAEMNRMHAEHPHGLGRDDGVAGLFTNGSIHFTGCGALHARSEDISESLSDCGIEDGFVLSLVDMLSADTSALFLVLRKSQSGEVLEGLSGFRGRVLRSSLSADQLPRLHSALSRVRTAPR